MIDPTFGAVYTANELSLGDTEAERVRPESLKSSIAPPSKRGGTKYTWSVAADIGEIIQEPLQLVAAQDYRMQHGSPQAGHRRVGVDDG